MSNAVLEVRNLCKSFGGVRALRDLSISVAPGQVLGLIGPNGSGKSTTVNTLAGLFPASSGEIRLSGAPIHTLPEWDRVTRGLTRTFQTASVFPEFTVRQQIRLGCEATRRSRPIASAFGFGRHPGETAEVEARVDQALELTGLEELAEREIATLSAAQQRFLMIATGLAAAPKVILLDEPAAGMVAHERRVLTDMIRRIRDSGVAVLVIEHHMALIMEVCDRIAVLNFGALIAEGTPAEIRENRAVIDAYLGEAA
ncbi:ABC transporter ATP-binding protein [Roseivivax sp. CAU 1761]